VKARGQPRGFSEHDSFYIACAAKLLSAGFKREKVKALFAQLSRIPWPPRQPRWAGQAGMSIKFQPETLLHALFCFASKRSLLTLAPGGYFRVEVGGFQSGWIEPNQLAPLSEHYQPDIAVEIDLGRMWANFSSPGVMG
jgi:hypothetical protein